MNSKILIIRDFNTPHSKWIDYQDETSKDKMNLIRPVGPNRHIENFSIQRQQNTHSSQAHVEHSSG